MKLYPLLIGLTLFFTSGVFAQNRPLSCKESRDRALTRVTIVSNSRVLMEEDLAALSVTLRYQRQRAAVMKREIADLKEQLKVTTKEKTETKPPDAETKPVETETEAAESETEDTESETVKEEPTQ